MASQKKMRKSNFSHREVMVMLENILENKRTIMSSICSDLSNKDKNKVWQMIAEKVSSLGTSTRTSDEVREKFYNLKREHRARASAREKTGNGGVIAKPYDDILDAIVGKDTELVKGVRGGGHDIYKDRHTFACSESFLNETILENPGSNTVTLLDPFPKSPEVLQAVEVQPLNDVEAQIPSCQAPVEPPSQENAKDKAKQYRPKKQQLLQKEKRQRTGTEESPLMSEYLESCITLNRYSTELVKLKILDLKQRMKIGDTTGASTSASSE